MNSVSYLIPISLGLGLIALGAFLWSLDREQYEDLEGAASRILTDKDAPALDRNRDDREHRASGQETTRGVDQATR
jgi:cbb3-type cytochrome oxidase maturation protein